MQILKESLIKVIQETSTALPRDVLDALIAARDKEKKGETARIAMDTIIENCNLAAKNKLPVCQDTGSLLFFVKLPQNFGQANFKVAAVQAVAQATEIGLLRENSVETISGKIAKDNLGPGNPFFHIEEWDRNDIEVRLILKGGGSENVSRQYSLPDENLNADRDLNGTKLCILDSIFKAQGMGCPPGIIGVCIGGDRLSGYLHSKEQLLRKLDDTNEIPELATLEKEIVEKANKLGIGPMGFGGLATLLGCKIGVLNRLPASYFVTVSYMCWAFRRQGAVFDAKGNIKNWLY